MDEDTKKPMVNYDIALLVIPNMLAGTIIGVSLNRSLPDILLLVLLTLLIVRAIGKTWKKAFNMRKRETVALEEVKRGGSFL